MADQPNTHLGLSISGWLRSDAAKIAHYFPDSATSACHLWVATTLDHPAPPGSPRCPTCAEAVKHGLV